MYVQLYQGDSAHYLEKNFKKEWINYSCNHYPTLTVTKEILADTFIAKYHAFLDEKHRVTFERVVIGMDSKKDLKQFHKSVKPQVKKSETSRHKVESIDSLLNVSMP